MTRNIRKLALMVPVSLIIVFIIIGISAFSCLENKVTQAKASSELLLQVNLRRQQLANPTAERLAEMRSLGMRTENIGVQRIYIHLSQRLTEAQANELRALGITLYTDSWIPPVGQHPTGFMLADMPVDKLDVLAARDYVVRLDTAERQLEPQLR